MTARWRGLTGGRASRVALENGDVARVVAGFGSVTLGEWVLGTAVAIAAYGAGGTLAVALVGFRFGEIAVLHRRPRLATVVATEDTVVLTITGDALRVCLAGREDPVGTLATLA